MGDQSKPLRLHNFSVIHPEQYFSERGAITMEIAYELMRSWPPLAWCARIDADSGLITVRHGGSVETRPDWFCEGVWDGAFEDGEFVTSDNFFGSGGRKGEGEVTFASSCTPMDRLHHISIDRTHFVSNSLPCLLSQSRSDVSPTYSAFQDEAFRAVFAGIRANAQTLPTSNGLVHLTLARDVVYRDGKIVRAYKNLPRRRFRNFEDYESFLRTSLQDIAANMQSPTRALPYSFVAGISSGYDSPTVCTLAKSAGLKEVFTFPRGRGYVDDDGSHIAARLGFKKIHKLGRYGWRQKEWPEVPFYAAVGFPSGVEMAGVDHLLRNRVYLSGSFGDAIWDVAAQPEQISDYRRNDHTGLDLSEYRLWTNFIHVPVPYIGYTGLEDVTAIAKSDAMKPWDYSFTAEYHYSRPICRRIVEQAGVPRDGFAFDKRAATYGDFEANMTKPTLREVYCYNRAAARAAGERKLAPSLLDVAWFKLVATTSDMLIWLGTKRFKGSWRVRHAGKNLQKLRSYEFSFNRAFPWAIERAKQIYDREAQVSDLLSIARTARKPQASQPVAASRQYSGSDRAA